MADMSSRNPEAGERTLLQLMRFAQEQFRKSLSVARPGLVESYDAATRRAQVRIAVDLVLNDGSRVDAPVIADVPVIHLSGGGYVAHMPLAAGDAVILLFSDRGMTEFKQTYRRAAPEAVMELKDAVAIPGFGPLTQSLPVTDGAYLGTDAGDEYVAIQAGQTTIVSTGRVNIEAPDEILLDGPVRITGAATAESTMAVSGQISGSDGLDITGDIDVTGTVDGVNVSSHRHTLVQVGSGKSGPPG